MSGPASSIYLRLRTAPWRAISERAESYLRPARDAIVLACFGLALIHLVGLTPLGVDAWAYWHADPAHPYGGDAVPGGVGHPYLYSPAFTQALGPLHALSWEVFSFAATLALTAALVWQAGIWVAPAFLLLPQIPIDMLFGNIHLLLGAAIVIGFRWPWAWSFVLLTKVTPGIGLLWFAVRREWRALATALGATAIVAGVSFVIAPDLWWSWIDVLRASAGAPDPGGTIAVPLTARLLAAAALVTWGARTNRRWTVVVASTIALPVLWLNGLAMLVGVIPLLALGRETTPAARFLSRSARPSGTRPLAIPPATP